MIIKRIKKSILSVFSILFVIVALTSCGDFLPPSSDDQGSVSHDGTNMTLEFPVPRFLAFSPSATDSLKAQATIDGGISYALDIDPNTNQISGTMTGVPSGTYDLVISYFISISDNALDDAGDNAVVLCIYSTQVTVNPGETTYVKILPIDLDRNIDDDHDGYTNLAEVRIKTDPLDASSVPAGESPYVICANGSTNSVESTNFKLTGIVGSALAGTASSTNYSVIVSFTGYESKGN